VSRQKKIENPARKPNKKGVFYRFAELFFKRLLVTHLERHWRKTLKKSWEVSILEFSIVIMSNAGEPSAAA
jgi:hypothetical protein